MSHKVQPKALFSHLRPAWPPLLSGTLHHQTLCLEPPKNPGPETGAVLLVAERSSMTALAPSMNAKWHQQPLRRAENRCLHPLPTLPPVPCKRRSTGHRPLDLGSGVLPVGPLERPSGVGGRYECGLCRGGAAGGRQVRWGAVPGAQRALGGLQGRRPDPESTESTLGKLGARPPARSHW